MLYWTLVFFVVATIAGAIGLGGMAASSVAIVQLLFFMVLAFVALSLFASFCRRAR